MIRAALSRVGLSKSPSVVAAVRLNGVIRAGQSNPRNPIINLNVADKALTKAFAVHGVKAVAVCINSPGGSPVQSSLVYKRLLQLKAKHSETPLLMFVEDVAASGGYYIACAGDEIIADENSVLGSIGVIRAGFGLKKTIEKLGMERRVQTAGASKSVLDPFSPEKPRDVETVSRLLENIHDNFKDVVQTSRGERLDKEKALAHVESIARAAGVEAVGDGLFDGSFYAGQQAVDLGLADSIGNLHSSVAERFGDDTVIKDIKVAAGHPLAALLPGVDFGLNGQTGFADRIGEAAVDSIAREIENRALWDAYGVQMPR